MKLERDVKIYSDKVIHRYFTLLEMWPNEAAGKEADFAAVADVLCQLKPELTPKEAAGIVKALSEGIINGPQINNMLAERLDGRAPINRQVSAFLNQEGIDGEARKERLCSAREMLLKELGRKSTYDEKRGFMELDDDKQCEIIGELLNEYSYQAASEMLEIAKDARYELSLGLEHGTIYYDDRLLAISLAIWLEDGSKDPVKVTSIGNAVASMADTVKNAVETVKNAAESNAGEAFLEIVGGISMLVMTVVLGAKAIAAATGALIALTAAGTLSVIGSILLLTAGMAVGSALIIGGIKLIEMGWSRWRENRRMTAEKPVIETDFVNNDDHHEAPDGV